MLLAACALAALPACRYSEDEEIIDSNDANFAVDNMVVQVFSAESCMEEYFPLAQAVTPPPEVRFYCAAPWNVETFRSVRTALDDAGIDLAGVMIRMTPPEGRAVQEVAAPMAVQQADQGPPGMGNVYRAQKLLPFLWAIRNGTDQETLAMFAPEDLEKLKAAGAAIDWDLPAVEPVDISEGEAVKSGAKLSDIPPIILSGAY